MSSTITAKVNNDKIFTLASWDAQNFNATLTLNIQSMDIAEIKSAFTHIELLEIFRDTTCVASFTSLDTFSQITYLGTQYSEASKRFVDVVSVTLTKTSIVEQVQRLDNQINKNVDPTTLTMEELRTYKLESVNKACQADIFNGETVVLPDGTQEHFRFTIEDQLDLKTLYDLVVANPAVEYLPFHPHHGACKIYNRREIIVIYATLIMRLTQLTTYANQLHMYIRTIDNRDTLMAVEYGMELPEEYAQNMANIMGVTIAEMQKILGDLPTNDETGSE